MKEIYSLKQNFTKTDNFLLESAQVTTDRSVPVSEI